MELQGNRNLLLVQLVDFHVLQCPKEISVWDTFRRSVSITLNTQKTVHGC